MARVDLPYEFNGLQQTMIAEGTPAAEAEPFAMVIMFVIIAGSLIPGLLMVVAQLLYFTRPSVIEAFQGERGTG